MGAADRDRWKFGRLNGGPGGRRHYGGGAGNYHFAMLIDGCRFQGHDIFVRGLFNYLEIDGDRIAQLDRTFEPEGLSKVNGAGSRQFHRQRGGNQTAGIHAMGNPLTEHRAAGKRGIKVDRVDVAGDCGKQNQIVLGQGFAVGSGLADLQLIESEILQFAHGFAGSLGIRDNGCLLHP